MKKMICILAGLILTLLSSYAEAQSPQPVIQSGSGLISEGVNLVGPSTASINWTISSAPQTYILEIAEVNAQGGVISSRTPAVFSPSPAGSTSGSFPINFNTDPFFLLAGAGGYRVSLTAFFPNQQPTPAVFNFTINAPSPTLGVTPISVEGESNAGFQFNMDSGITGVPQYRYTVSAIPADTRGEKGAAQQFVYGPMAESTTVATITKADLAPGNYSFTVTVETAIGGNPVNQAFGTSAAVGPFRLNAAPGTPVFASIAPVVNVDSPGNDMTRTFTITAFDDVNQQMTVNIDLVRIASGGQVDATVPAFTATSGVPQNFDVTFPVAGESYELRALITDSDNAINPGNVSTPFLVNDVPMNIAFVSSDLVSGIPAFDVAGSGPYSLNLTVQASDDSGDALGVILAYPGSSQSVGSFTPSSANTIGTLDVPGFNVSAGSGVVNFDITVTDIHGNSATIAAPILINREPFNLNLDVTNPVPTDMINGDTLLIPETLPFNLAFGADDNGLPQGADSSLDFVISATDGVSSPATVISISGQPGAPQAATVSIQAGTVFDLGMTVTDFRGQVSSITGTKFRINAAPVPSFLDAIFSEPGTPVIQAEYIPGTLNRSTGVGRYRTTYSVSAIDEVGAPSSLAITAVVDATTTPTATSSVPAVANDTPTDIDFDFILNFDTNVSRNRNLQLEAIDSETMIVNLVGSTSREVLINGQPIIDFTRVEYYDLLERNGDLATVQILVGFYVYDDASGRTPARDDKGLASDLLIDVNNTLNNTVVVEDSPVSHGEEQIFLVTYDVDTAQAGPNGSEMSIMVSAVDGDGGQASVSRSFTYSLINRAGNWAVYE